MDGAGAAEFLLGQGLPLNAGPKDEHNGFKDLVLPAFVWPHFQASAVEQNGSAEVLEVAESPRC